MKIFKLILFASLSIILIGYGNNTKKGKQNDFPKDWKTIDRPDFSIEYPDSLALNKSGKMGTIFILFLDQETRKGSFRENINLTIEDLTGKNIDLDKYIKISKEQLNNIITGW